MKLSSVRDLKAELLASPSSLIATAPTAGTHALAARSARARTAKASGGMEAIALGAARAKKDYRLAVRLQEAGPLYHAMAEEISKRAKGEVDVRYIGRLVKFPSQASAAFYRARRRPLRIGSSISDVHASFVSAGTLGCFVYGRSSPHYLGMLTNNHVIADENGNKAGSPVVQQGTLDGGDKPDDLVGELWKTVKLKKSGTNFVDAAVGALYDDVDFDERKVGTLGNLQGVGDIASLPERAIVHKVGRTTGQTKGRITAFDIDNVKVTYDMGVLRFDDQIEIEGTGSKAFSDAGDSGSAIVDAGRHVVALLFAGGDVGGSNGKGLTYANPIQPVLDATRTKLLL